MFWYIAFFNCILYIININVLFFYPIFKLFLILFLSHPETGICTISDHHDGVLIYLYPSGSTLNLVSRQTFLHLKNRWYSPHFGFFDIQITHISFASSKSSFLFGYSNLLSPLNFFACFCWTAFLAAIHLLFVLAILVLYRLNFLINL
jgi:hypothetical protein